MCICPILDVAHYRLEGKKKEALVIFPLTTCPEHAEYGFAAEAPSWWPSFPTLDSL